MKKPQIPIYIHGIQRSIRVNQHFDIPYHLVRMRFGCQCLFKRWVVLCKKCVNQMVTFVGRYRLPVRWIGVSERVGGHLVNMTGSADPEQFNELLGLWGVPEEAREYKGVKRAEVFMALMGKQAERAADYLRSFSVVPCPNRIVEQPISEDASEDDAPQEPDDSGWTDGMKRIIFQGEFVETTLPRFDKGIRYFICIYKIIRTPDFPSKCEIILVAPPRVWLTEEELLVSLKAMAQLLAAIAQGARITPVDIAHWTKMEGERFNLASKRGLSVNPDWMRRAAGLADQNDMGKADDDSLTRETIRAVFPLCLGRPLTDDDISERLNSVVGRRVFERLQRRYRYRWIPQSETMRRLRAAVLGSRRMEDEDGESPEVDEEAACAGLDAEPESGMQSVVVKGSGITEAVDVEMDEYRGLLDDLLNEVATEAAP